jgi:hypothetical protein
MPLFKSKKTNKPSAPKLHFAPYSKSKVNKTDFNDWAKNSKEILLPDDIFSDPSPFYRSFLENIAKVVPSVSTAVWVWEKLSSTHQSVKYKGGTDATREKAKSIITDLDSRLSPFPFVKKAGMDLLISQFFHSLFSVGRFAGQIILDPNLKRIETFQMLDPFSIRFQRGTFIPFYQHRPGRYTALNPNTFFYYGLHMSQENPYGYSMSETAAPFIKIANEILSDMRSFLSNAGVPRLHIKINQPEMMDGEDPDLYRKRIEAYFNGTVSQFADIAPDDNAYTWDDVEIGTIGAQGPSGYIWRSNRQILDEEIISAFHLYPWVMGRSFSTTKNWVVSQFDLLLSQIEAVQLTAKRFAEWIRNLELNLAGIIDVRTSHSFDMVRDPAAKEQAIAERFRIQNAKSKAVAGFISPDDAARELGYDRAFDSQRLLKSNPGADGPINKQDDADLSFVDDKIDQLEYSISDKFSEIQQIITAAFPQQKGKK